MTRGPTMHTVHSRSGRHKAKRLGMTDKGTSRDSSMGKSFGKRNYSRAVR